MKFEYFGYGANKDIDMIKAITGTYLFGKCAYIEGYKLGVQKLDNIPEIPQNQLNKFWSDKGFESYVVIKSDNEKDRVYGTLWTMSENDRECVREWELIPLGWYTEVPVTAILENGIEVQAVTEIIIGQSVDRLVEGKNYPAYLINKNIILKHAEDVR